MPRIRSLKPEHKQHRKVGMLTHRQYRLWIGMITEADDEGRLVAEAAQLRALIFAYHPTVTIPHVSEDLASLESVGLIRLYRFRDTLYAEFPSWYDHQTINRPQPSKLPPFQIDRNDTGTFNERSVIAPEGSESLGVFGNGTNSDVNDGTIHDNFETFWHAYPRKVGKGAARKSWHKARPPLDTVLAVLARQRTSRDWTKDGGQFIPHPATWLNQERWLDQVAAGDEEDEE